MHKVKKPQGGRKVSDKHIRILPQQYKNDIRHKNLIRNLFILKGKTSWRKWPVSLGLDENYAYTLYKLMNDKTRMPTLALVLLISDATGYSIDELLFTKIKSPTSAKIRRTDE